jgi:hypothetical protein
LLIVNLGVAALSGIVVLILSLAVNGRMMKRRALDEGDGFIQPRSFSFKRSIAFIAVSLCSR